MSSFQASSATSYKRFISGAGIVDSAGNCTIIFDSAPKGSYYTGSISVYDSPIQATWLVAINGVNFDIISGQATCAGIQIGPNDSLTISTTGLSTLIGNTIHATYSVIVSPENDTDLLIPGHDTFFPSTVSSTLLPPPVISGGLQSFVDTTGETWIASPGIRGGNWYRASDVLHASYYRTTAWTAAATTWTTLAADTIINDPYGIGTAYSSSGIWSCPIAGVWQGYWSCGVTATAAGQYFQAAINNVSLNNIGSAIAHSSQAAALAVNLTVTRFLNVGDQYVTRHYNGTAGMAGRNSSDITRFQIDYLGAG